MTIGLLPAIQERMRENDSHGYESELYLSSKALDILDKEIGLPINGGCSSMYLLGMRVNYSDDKDIEVRRLPITTAGKERVKRAALAIKQYIG